MGTVITNLKARFGVDSSDYKKGLKDGEKATQDFKGAAGTAIDEFATMFGVNMSGVTDAVRTVGNSLSFLSKSFSAAEQGGNKFAIGMKVVKVAIASTGFGVIIVALGSLMAYFSKSGEGADKFAKIIDQVKSVVNNIIDRLAIFGKGLLEIGSGKFKAGWETLKSSVKGLGDEITADWKASGLLADAMDKLEDKEIELIKTLSERKAQASELRQLAKEETEDQRKKLSMINEASALYKSAYGDEIALERERLRIMNERLAIQSSDPTDEQRKTIAEQEAKINDLYRQQADQLKGLNREKKTALESVTAEIELEKAKTAQVTIRIAAINNIKMPDFADMFAGIKNIEDPFADLNKRIAAADAANRKLAEGIESTKAALASFNGQLTQSLNTALSTAAVGMGEFFGSLVSGEASMAGFSDLIASTFGNMAVTVGTIAIQTGIATLGIKAALESLNGYVAIAAGIALVALGTAVRGSLKGAASGKGASSVSSGGSLVYDGRPKTAQQSNFAGANEVIERPVFNTDAIKLLGKTIHEELSPLADEFRAVGSIIRDAFVNLSAVLSGIQFEKSPGKTVTESTYSEKLIENTNIQKIIEPLFQMPDIPALKFDFRAIDNFAFSMRDQLTGMKPISFEDSPRNTGFAPVNSPGIKVVHLKVSGELMGSGNTLRAVLREEDTRINITT